MEWLFQGERATAPWLGALEKSLADPRCVILGIYNWEGIRDSPEILAALRQVLAVQA